MRSCTVSQIATGLKGGAGGALSRLHRGLKNSGAHSIVYTLVDGDEYESSTSFHRSPRFRARLRRFYRGKRKWLNSLFYPELARQAPPLFSSERSPYADSVVDQMPEAHLVNLHWVAEFVDYASFFRQVAGSKPIVWTLHDMNPFTGGCHYDGGCRGYENECGHCPQLSRPHENDLSRKIWRRKAKVFRGLAPDDLTVVTPSRWLKVCVENSSLMGKFPIRHIPNGVDIEVYSPRDQTLARQALDMSLNDNLILFVSEKNTEARKGAEYLCEAMGKLKTDQASHALLSLGKGKTDVADVKHRHLGFVEDDALVALAYSAADVFVIPSLQDNLPNTVLESMACGTPVVGFDVGGIPDMVRSGETGLLAPVKDVDELTRCIKRVLTDEELRQRMSQRCREVAVEEYSLGLQAERYTKLYGQLLEQRQNT